MVEFKTYMLPFKCEGVDIAETRERVKANAHKTVVINQEGKIVDSEISCRIKTKEGKCMWSHPIRECGQIYPHKTQPDST